MKFLPGLFTLLLTGAVAKTMAQHPVKDSIAVPDNLKRFVPNGYSVLNITTGDLNKDTYPDAAMVLYKLDEEETSSEPAHPEKRPLLLLTGQANHTYQLAARSDNAVYCIDCGGQVGEPFMGITIKNGYFSIDHYGGSGWRWTRNITFKYSPHKKNWFLYKDGGDYYRATDPENVKTRVKTVKNFGLVPFQKFDIYKDQH